MVGGSAIAPGTMHAVVVVGNCSGVVVKPDLVLTSAHCVQQPIAQLKIAGRDIGVVRCVPHPAYRSLRLQHDIAYCKLAVRASVSAISIANVPLPRGRPVTLAGYGATGALAHDGGALRIVATSVGGDSERLQVGSPDRTACWGDSGAPVFVFGENGWNTVGIIHGPSGAICASSSDVVWLSAERRWLDEVIAEPSSGWVSPPSLSPWTACFVGTGALAIAMRWIVRHRGRTRSA